MADPDEAPQRDLRGATRLAVDATVGVTDVVEAMHRTIASAPFAPVFRALGAPVYATVRGVTGAVGAGIDRALAELAPLVGDRAGPEADAVRAALNGVLGDHLVATDNPLAIPMQLRPATAEPGGRVLVLVHGSSMSDRQWARRGHDHGAALARDLGYAPVYVRYNTRERSRRERDAAACRGSIAMSSRSHGAPVVRARAVVMGIGVRPCEAGRTTIAACTSRPTAAPSRGCWRGWSRRGRCR
ncbi:MAG: hypothetical protein R3F59_25095 [Myxococcota bacterium]